MKNTIRIYALAIKYWFQGDDWPKAVEYATALVKGWKRPKQSNYIIGSDKGE